MDKYYLALLGEAGATGLAKAFYVRFKKDELKRAYEQELSHWKYFKQFRSSKLELPVYYSLFLFGLLVSLFGFSTVRKVIRKVEEGAIDFYLKNFDPQDLTIRKIIEDERHHMEV